MTYLVPTQPSTTRFKIVAPQDTSKIFCFLLQRCTTRGDVFCSYVDEPSVESLLYCFVRGTLQPFFCWEQALESFVFKMLSLLLKIVDSVLRETAYSFATSVFFLPDDTALIISTLSSRENTFLFGVLCPWQLVLRTNRARILRKRG